MQFLRLCDQKPRIDSKFDAVNCETHDASNSVYSRIEPISSPTHDPVTMSRISFQQPDGGSFESRTSSDDMDALKLLLDQEDNRGRKSKSALRSKMQRIGRTSKTALTKKILRRKSRDDSELARITHSLTESLNELTLRYSPTSMMRNSVTDIGGVLKKKVIGSDKLKFERSSSDGSGMAALLVSSMMAAPSLRCIHETQDVQPESSRSMQSKDSLIVPSPYPSSMLIKESNSNLSSYSISSISISSSVDEESDDEIERNLKKVESDTVSMVVKKVMAHERERTRSYSNDDLDALLSKSPDEPKSLHPHGIAQQSSFQIVRPKLSNTDRSNLVSSIDLDPDADNWIQPGSTVDEPELSAEERESKFHELKENLIGTMHTLQEHIHIPTNELFHHGDDHHHHLNDAFQNMLKGQVAIVAADPTLCDTTINTTAHHPHKSFRNRLTSFCKRFRASTSAGDVQVKADLIQVARKHPLIDIPKYDTIPTIQLSNSINDMSVEQPFYGNNSYGSAIELSSPKETTIRSFMSMPDLSHDLHQLVDLSGLNSIDSLRAGLTIANQRHASTHHPAIANTTTKAIPTKSTLANKPQHHNAIEKCAKDHAAISTNPASLLAPLPLFPHRVFDKVPATSGGAAAVSQTSVPPAAVKSCPITNQSLKKDHGHIRAESSGCKIPQNSPLKNTATGVSSQMTTSVGSSGTSTKDKESACRRSSDSDLSVTPKGMQFNNNITICIKYGIGLFFTRCIYILHGI